MTDYKPQHTPTVNQEAFANISKIIERDTKVTTYK